MAREQSKSESDESPCVPQINFLRKHATNDYLEIFHKNCGVTRPRSTARTEKLARNETSVVNKAIH